MKSAKLRLRDVAKIVRSKNAGPFLITLDVMFDDVSDYLKFKNNNYITREKIKELYMLRNEDILEFLYYDNAKAFKVTFKRTIPSGGVGDTDIYGAQQHVPLLLIEVDPW